MKAKLNCYGVTCDVEGTYDECSRIIAVWYTMSLAVVRATHGDISEAERQLAAAIKSATDGRIKH